MAVGVQLIAAVDEFLNRVVTDHSSRTSVQRGMAQAALAFQEAHVTD